MIFYVLVEDQVKVEVLAFFKGLLEIRWRSIGSDWSDVACGHSEVESVITHLDIHRQI